GEGHQPLEGAVVATHAREATAVHAAAEELAELPLDERWNTRPVGTGSGGGEERVQMLPHHPVQHGRIRRPRRVSGGHGRGPSERRAGRPTGPSGGPGLSARRRAASHELPVKRACNILLPAARLL